MAKHSAGLLLHRSPSGRREVLLVHPGGPFWAKKDVGAWSLPKGEVEAGEDPLAVARREFTEELGLAVPDVAADVLGEVTQAGGKVVAAWAMAADVDVATIVSNTFELEWPPRSGRVVEFPEVDRAEWFDLETAREKINGAQAAFLDRLPPLAG